MLFQLLKNPSNKFHIICFIDVDQNVILIENNQNT